MATLKVPKGEIEKIAKITPELLEQMNLMGIPIEKVDDNEIELEVLPNRPDALSEQGYLRALWNYITGKSKNEYKIRKSGFEIIVDKAVREIRPYCMAAIVKGVVFDNERIKGIMQWQEKIHATVGRNRKKVALGYYELDKIKFPVKYTARKPEEIVFEPLGIAEKMNGRQIISRHLCGREYGEQLKGFEKFPVYYDANNEVLSMPPIINSNNSGQITQGTSEVLIECSGTDLQILKKVIAIAVADLIDLGGKAYSVDVIYNDRKEFVNLKPDVMKINFNNINKLLGLNLKEKELEKLLQKMGHKYKKGKVEIPAWRMDILHEVDIIEDIAIAYGYNNFAPEIPKVATIAEESVEGKFKTKISEILIGMGLLEASSYHLIKKEEAELMKLENPLELENSKTEYKFLRPNLLIPCLRIFSENKDNEYPQRIFEIGSVFSRSEGSETGIKETENLIIATSPSNFTEIKQMLDYLFKMLELEYSFEEAVIKWLIDGRAAKILLNNKPIGYIGELHPQTLREWGIKMPISVLEISLEEIFKILGKEQ